MKGLKVIAICITLIVALITGCGKNAENPAVNRDSSFDINKVSDSVVQGNTQFAFNIFKQLNKDDAQKSIFISPYSISTALTMVYQGARGKTLDAMADTLNYKGIDINKLNEGYKSLLNNFKNIDDKIQLNIGNSIWIRKGFTVKKDFLSVNKDMFESKVTQLDFSLNGAADEINNWISDATKGKIPKMIEPPIPDEVLMYLINAIYFKGQWTDQFDKKQTFNAEFHDGNGKTEDIMMMGRNGDVEYGEAEGCKAVKLPYGNGRTAMYCILPDEGTSINTFIDTLDREKWSLIRAGLSETEEVQLQIPRFKVEYGIKELNDCLTKMGMGVAFSDSADFAGIANNVRISNVLHKAVIEVNEEGSEAAAATVVSVDESAALKPITFIANRPFVFIIADDVTGTILFMGKLYNN